MQETRVQSLGPEDPREKALATHCSILAWKIPWMEEPGGLQSMGVAESDTTEQLHLVSQNCTLYKSNFYVICFQPKLKKTKNLLSLAKGKCKGQCSKTENAQALVVLLGPTAQLTPRPARTPSSMESARPPSRGWSKASAHLPGWSQRRPHVSQDPHPCCLARVPPTETTREQKHGP